MSLECRPVDQRADDRLHEHLLTFLRDTLRIPELAYAEPPVRLSGGYFTTVYALRLAGAAPPWSEPLILRVMPDHSEALLLRRERAVQNVVADLGFPAPRVLASSDGRETLGHAFLLMERMPGRALLGGVELRWILTRGVRLLQTLPRITAETQARLHALDPEPLRRAMEAEGIPPQCAGVERWLNEIAATVERWSLDGLLPGLHWLIDRRPRELQRQAICHGDLWAGNILVAGGRVTGVVDWSLTAIADPAYDVGFTKAALEMAPIRGPAPVRRVVTLVGKYLARRFYERYRELREIDPEAVRYYEAMRCMVELQFVVSNRLRLAATGAARDMPSPVWDEDQLIGHFRTIAGISLDPTPAAAPTKTGSERGSRLSG